MRDYKLFDYYQMMEGQRMILTFKGSMSGNILVGMAEKIKATLTDNDEKQRVVQRIFSVFIELSQNIHHYSAERLGKGIIVVEDHKDCYKVVSGNLIKNSEIPPLEEKINRINGLDRAQLRAYYYSLLKTPRTSGKLGGSVGLISIAREAGNPIGLTVNPMDENQSFIEIAAEITKEAGQNGKSGHKAHRQHTGR